MLVGFQKHQGQRRRQAEAAPQNTTPKHRPLNPPLSHLRPAKLDVINTILQSEISSTQPCKVDTHIVVSRESKSPRLGKDRITESSHWFVCALLQDVIDKNQTSKRRDIGLAQWVQDCPRQMPVRP